MAKSQKAKWIYVATGMLISLVCICLARLSYGVILPFMKEGLSLSYQLAGLLGTITSFGYLLFVMSAGILANKWGEKKTILFGLSLITIGFFNLSIASSFWYSSIFMFLLGAGTAFTFTPIVTLLIKWFPEKKGTVIGFINSGAGIGMVFTGSLVPLLNQLYPDTAWQLTWKIFFIISLLVVLNTFLFIKNPPAEPVTEAKNYLPARMIYRNWNVIKVGLIYGITGMTFIIQSMFIMSFMLESGINQQLAGQLVALNGILSIFSSLIWGGLSDRLGRKNALIAAMGFNLLSTVIPVIFLNSIGFTINLVLQGLVATGVFTLVQTLSTEQVPAQATSVAYSYVTFIFAIGQFIGPTIAGWLIDFGNFKSVFLFSSIFIAAALYLAKKVPSDKPAEPALSPDLNH